MPSEGSTPITGSTSTTDGTLVSKRRKLTSVVWNDFDKIIEDGQDYAICKHCKGKLKVDTKNGTKHLHVHIDRCMKRRNVDWQQLLAVERKGHGKVQIGGFTFDKEISREKLARAIILHEYPLSIIDHVGFREFATSLQPLFKMVSRNTIKGDIMKIYEVEKDKMISYLEKLQSRVAITTDMWTSNQKKGYMAITVHYIDESWLLHHHIVRQAADTFGGSELAILGPDSVVFYLSFCHIFEKVYLQVSSMTLDRSRSPPQAKRLRSSDRASYRDTPYPRHRRVHRDCPNVTVCNNCGLPGHIAAECNSTTICWNCKESGHLASQCPNDLVCHMCGKMGHLARDCSCPSLPTHDARLCNNCYKPGHIATDCTNEKACNIFR
ncbi:hypothetical protein VitviT2T_019939 [Vitis vinifera]|uniref:CCHC-type domain-containing protein n=1 Tax=Vitis vinifera TaxID=29760 RepID=A0ABY9D215_VITVI|nr:hypothetical protein VitviT2T_019939 [Vitis vinifera]